MPPNLPAGEWRQDLNHRALADRDPRVRAHARGRAVDEEGGPGQHVEEAGIGHPVRARRGERLGRGCAPPPAPPRRQPRPLLPPSNELSPWPRRLSSLVTGSGRRCPRIPIFLPGRQRFGGGEGLSSLLVLTSALEPSAEVLPALGLLLHSVRVAPAEASALVDAAPADAVLDRRAARTRARQEPVPPAAHDRP